MSRRIAVVVAVVVAVVSVSVCAIALDNAAKYPSEPPIVPGRRVETSIIFDRMSRAYNLYVPTDLPSDRAVPLIVNLHCFTCVAEDQMAFSHFEVVAEENKFLVVHPRGYGRSWNAGPSCCPPAYPNIDDVGFLRAVVADISRKYAVDSRRIYAIGFSNGAAMSFRLACDSADLFAAFATMAGYDPYESQLLSNCRPSRPMPLLFFVGTNDPFCPTEGSIKTINDWLTLTGCRQSGAVSFQRGVTTCTSYTDGCPLQNGGIATNVTACFSEGESHFYWPGSPGYPDGNNDIDASRQMRSFLSEYML
eukprot:TRINITY_DN139_c0_g1_i1.p1 TRINITY_DN139_c0_g1~~TRINITY_DN139_c0_g1_i1.p1  ORF type:complete len:306 (-),score=56.56 TRINITY_DN139_c0_g1_i1:99-1016(-)